MDQIRTKTGYVKRSTQWLVLLSLSLVAFSCAPKKQGVRAQVKTTGTPLSPGTSAVADQQATAQNAIYKISSISLPESTGAGVVVNSDLLTPNNQYLPISTAHEKGQLDSQGIFNDTSRGLQVYVNARCSDSECTKYLLLVTVVRNNQAVYQSGAISYKDDCNFYYVSNTSTTGQMHQSMDSFSSTFANVQPSGDSTSCLQ
jgi:hypothetical protein